MKQWLWILGQQKHSADRLETRQSASSTRRLMTLFTPPRPNSGVAIPPSTFDLGPHDLLTPRLLTHPGRLDSPRCLLALPSPVTWRLEAVRVQDTLSYGGAIRSTRGSYQAQPRLPWKLVLEHV